MLTKLIINNFKKFDQLQIDLGNPVVFIGPNNSGKTSALQALALWGLAYWKWQPGARLNGLNIPPKNEGITLNRKDLSNIPIPVANLLWKNLLTHSGLKVSDNVNTGDIPIEITVEGSEMHGVWKNGFSFRYANEESFYCKPIEFSDNAFVKSSQNRVSPSEIKMVYLPPMSGLADREFIKQKGEIDFLIGQGQTSQVLRNLCLITWQEFPSQWELIVSHIKELFGITLLPPSISGQSEIFLNYLENNGTQLDISASGRGLHQTLFLLNHLCTNKNCILLLDEPDAHLEIIRQRQNFNLLTQIADQQQSQIIAASHSEVILNEAAVTGTVVAFIGNPHTLNKQSSQLIKSLTSIGFDQYYLAETNGWVLYLEDASDLAILKTFAQVLQHPALPILESAFVHYISTNVPSKAREHFFGLREAKNDLLGIAIFDRLDKELNGNEPLIEKMWEKREIENYFCQRNMLLRFAESISLDFKESTTINFRNKLAEQMHESVSEIENALKTIDKSSPWGDDLKVSDEFLSPLFRLFSSKLNVPLVIRKNEYYKLIHFMKKDEISTEIIEKLDLIKNTAHKSKISKKE